MGHMGSIFEKNTPILRGHASPHEYLLASKGNSMTRHPLSFPRENWKHPKSLRYLGAERFTKQVKCVGFVFVFFLAFSDLLFWFLSHVVFVFGVFMCFYGVGFRGFKKGRGKIGDGLGLLMGNVCMDLPETFAGWNTLNVFRYSFGLPLLSNRSQMKV